MKKECVTMLLAGGAGTRLGALTQNLAKPAVPFGGRYRIIDFALSNCLNSHMFTVGVLTQYSPLELHKHIGVGKPWDLDRMHDGLTTLSPFTEHTGGNWYLGTADAITKNRTYIEGYDPDYLLVISGDHIYHMDYDKLLRHHKKTQADVTISVLEVPWKETSRFGILNTTDDLRIYDFEEKPLHAKSNLASMGIYIFNWNVLKDYLEKDATDPDSDHDFGKNILPAMLADNLRLYAYRFEGYWKDVGTIESYWEAHMDLLAEDLERFLNNNEWRTYSHDSNFPPQLIDEHAVVHQSLVNNGCIVSGTLDHSILFENVQVGKGATIKQSILHPGVRVGKNVYLERVIAKEDVVIPDNTTLIASDDQEPIVLSIENQKKMMNA
ncbi:glucose-1-phosphate adenylyltransferase [Aquibacillus koreensis]|uniref:Glucose-1-phosphate adenylyltransferase n=1 Tax=Aquibacillus koreensis TaxID=279446 RepID=A0A9X3WSJ6_9BACI|nr:glucose-1-phosphate adenylyltransferase [Aquibacillus koreensis]MCT2534177.1 glucose-1-phosphate adenylyltransferase [Aquibacillus koreensis]MDC3422569.1 glucose-1-phosphate adenylyltransferase [Aquibacillus koreensis]